MSPRPLARLIFLSRRVARPTRDDHRVDGALLARVQMIEDPPSIRNLARPVDLLSAVTALVTVSEKHRALNIRVPRIVVLHPIPLDILFRADVHIGLVLDDTELLSPIDLNLLHETDLEAHAH